MEERASGNGQVLDVNGKTPGLAGRRICL